MKAMSVGMVVVMLVLAPTDGVERRRPLYRRTSTTTASPVADDSEGSESKFKPNGKDLFTVSDSFPVSGGVGGQAGSFKSDGDKLTSFSEYSFGSTKLSGADGALLDGGINSSGEEPTFGGFKNHKKASPLLPTTNASTKDRKPTGGGSPFDFLNGDYAKPKTAQSGILNDAGLGGLGSKVKIPSTISSKFSISHPSPTPKTVGKLAHLDDSTEYDVYAGLGQSASSGKNKLTKHRQPLTGSGTYASSGGFEGKVKKVPFKYEDGGLGALAGKPSKTKTKLSLDDDITYGSASSPFPGLGSFESGSFGGGGRQPVQQTQQQTQQLGVAAGHGKGGKFNFAEPPPLVKSTLSTLKHFGEGLIGNSGNGAGRAPYELESEESGYHSAPNPGAGGVKFGSYFGKGHFGVTGASPPVEESYETSGEPLAKGKFTKPLGGKFATDFDVKNIKLTDGAGVAGFGGVGTGLGHKLAGAKGTPPAHHGKLAGHTLPHHHSHQHSHQLHHQLHHLQHSSQSALPGPHLQPQPAQAQAAQAPPHHTAHHHTGHGTPHGTPTGTIANPNPLDFRPNFQLQDVPNLYPADHLGAGIAAKGQIESFLNSEHALKDESLVAQLLGDQSPAARPHYHQFLKSQEDEKLEKEALRQQIEYLKAQAAKRPIDLAPGPHRPAIVSSAQKFRPVRRIPSHVRLGVKAPYPLPRIPNYNDRPYSISFKI